MPEPFTYTVKPNRRFTNKRVRDYGVFLVCEDTQEYLLAVPGFLTRRAAGVCCHLANTANLSPLELIRLTDDLKLPHTLTA